MEPKFRQGIEGSEWREAGRLGEGHRSGLEVPI